MKHIITILFLFLTVNPVFANPGDPGLSTPPVFNERIPKAIGMALLDGIQTYFKGKGGLRVHVSKDHPVLIRVDESQTGETPISGEYLGYRIYGKANVTSEIKGTMGSSSGMDTLPGFPIFQPSLMIESGHFVASGTYTVDGAEVVFKKGALSIRTNQGDMKIEEETVVMINHKSYVFRNSTWQSF